MTSPKENTVRVRAQQESRCIVSSWNVWDPLKRAIVGRADDCHIPPPEPAVIRRVPNDSEKTGQWGRRPEDAIAAANEQLGGLAAILRSRGIHIDRPSPLDFSRAVGTPDFEAKSMLGCMAPRDVLVTVGREILEASMLYRCRWFEYLCTRASDGSPHSATRAFGYL